MDTSKSAQVVPFRTIATVATLQAMLPTTSWLCNGWLPRGYLTMFAGSPGVGKSALALRIAESVMIGTAWPDGTLPQKADIGKVAWVDTEASQALLVQRCEQWQLPTGKLLIPSPDDNPLTDMRLTDPASWDALLYVMEVEKPPLVVIDSLRGSYRGDENSSDLAELLTKLAALARDKNTGILLVHHLRKASQFETFAEVNLDRIRGSSAIPALCRVVWALDTPDTDHRAKVRLSVIKSNLALAPPSIGLEVGENGLRFTEAPTAPRNETALERAIELMRDYLQGQPRRAVDVFAELKEAGVSEPTLRRAKTALRVVPTKHKDGWWWSLAAPEQDDQ